MQISLCLLFGLWQKIHVECMVDTLTLPTPFADGSCKHAASFDDRFMTDAIYAYVFVGQHGCSTIVLFFDFGLCSIVLSRRTSAIVDR